MESVLWMPFVIPFTIINPILLIKFLMSAVKKRVNGEKYTKEMFSMVSLLVSYIVFINIFY